MQAEGFFDVLQAFVETAADFFQLLLQLAFYWGFLYLLYRAGKPRSCRETGFYEEADQGKDQRVKVSVIVLDAKFFYKFLWGCRMAFADQVGLAYYEAYYGTLWGIEQRLSVYAEADVLLECWFDFQTNAQEQVLCLHYWLLVRRWGNTLEPDHLGSIPVFVPAGVSPDELQPVLAAALVDRVVAKLMSGQVVLAKSLAQAPSPFVNRYY